MIMKSVFEVWRTWLEPGCDEWQTPSVKVKSFAFRSNTFYSWRRMMEREKTRSECTLERY